MRCRENSDGTIIITLRFFYVEQYCLCGNISLVDFPNIKCLSFSPNKSSMAGERPSHKAGGLRYVLCVECVRLNETQAYIYRLQSIMGFCGFHTDKVAIATGDP